MGLKRKISKKIAAASLVAMAGSAFAQVSAPVEPHNVVQLSATGVAEEQQDWLQLSLSTTREGVDAGVVQSELKQALDAALAQAKRSAQPGQMDVRTGAFGLQPRHSKDGKLNGWQGQAELVLEGRDFARITSVAAKIGTLTIGQVEFGLSREARERAQAQAQSAAIEQFKARATELSRAFGFSGYTLREVAVNTNDMPWSPRGAMQMVRTAGAMADAPLAVEAGKAQVTVQVSGSVQMR